MNSKTLKFLAGIILIGIFTIVLYLIGSFIESSFNFLIWNKILKSVLAIVWFIFFVLVSVSTVEDMREKIPLGSPGSGMSFMLSDSMLREKYICFFKTYCDEDWNRDTPFIKEIEILSRYFSHSNTDKTLYPLDKKVRYIPITQELMQDLENIFKDDLNIILEMPLGKMLMFVADLKSYREGSSEHGGRTPEEFYNWRLIG